MGWKVIDHLTIYREKGMYGAHPNVVRTPNGDLLALFHRSPHLGYSHHGHPLFDLRACRSTDEAKTWEPQQLVTIDPLGGVIDFGTHTLADGSIFLHASAVALAPQQDGASATVWETASGRPFWSRSLDDGRNWSEPVRFPQLPAELKVGSHSEHQGICRSGLVELADGRLFLPGKAPSTAEGIGYPYFGMCHYSSDMGDNWHYGGKIAVDDTAHFSEPTVHITPKGRILILFRCHSQRGTTDRQVFLARVYSDDGGATWSQWERTPLEGCPGHMLGLRDGRIFITVGRRLPEESGCNARVLDPEGSDMDTVPSFVVRGDSTITKLPDGKPVSDCGYPWSVELADGKVLVVYYYTYEDGLRGIEGTVLEEG